MSSARDYFVAQVPRLLNASGLRVRYGSVEALTDFSIGVDAGEIVGLVGRAGSGKTSLLQVLTGHIRPAAGRIVLDRKWIDTDDPSINARHGLVGCLRPVPFMPKATALANVRVGCEQRRRVGAMAGFLRTPAHVRDQLRMDQTAAELLDVVGLKDFSDIVAGDLSSGQLMRISLARAVASEPRVMVVDDPVAGLDRGEAMHMLELIHDLHVRFRIPMLIAARELRPLMEICGRVVVVHQGRKVCEGNPYDIEEDSRYIETVTRSTWAG